MVAMVTMMKSPLQSTIHDHRSMIHKQRFTIKAPQASFQSTHSHKFTKMLSLSLLVYLCVGVGVFDFLLILWCDRVWICLIFGWFCGVSELWWGLLAVVVFGDAELQRCGWWCWVYVVVVLGLFCGGAKIMSWRERERDSGEDRMWGERNNTKIMYRRVTVTVHIYTVIVALVHLCTILHPLM